MPAQLHCTFSWRLGNMVCTGFIIQMNTASTDGEWIDVETSIPPTDRNFVLHNWDGTTQRFRIKALGSPGVSLDSNWAYFPLPEKPARPDFTEIPTYVFPTRYPTATTIRSWTTEGLQLYKVDGDVLSGTVPASIAEACPSIATKTNYYEITQTPTFLLQNDTSFPENTTFQKEITWRVPAPGKTYWQYNGPVNVTTDHIDAEHIMNDLLPEKSVHRAKFVDGQNRPISVNVNIAYYAMTKTYHLGVGSQEFSFTPDKLTTDGLGDSTKADEVNFVVQ